MFGTVSSLARVLKSGSSLQQHHSRHFHLRFDSQTANDACQRPHRADGFRAASRFALANIATVLALSRSPPFLLLVPNHVFLVRLWHQVAGSVHPRILQNDEILGDVQEKFLKVPLTNIKRISLEGLSLLIRHRHSILLENNHAGCFRELVVRFEVEQKISP